MALRNYNTDTIDFNQRNPLLRNTGDYVDPVNNLNSVVDNKYNQFKPPIKSNTPIDPSGKMTAGAISAGADLISTGAQAYFQYKENEKSRKEAIQLADLEEQDQTMMNEGYNKIRKKSFDQEQQEFALVKKKQAFDLRINRWLSALKKGNDDKQFMDSFIQTLNRTITSEDDRQRIVDLYNK